MPIEKATRIEDLPTGEVEVEIEQEDLPEISIEFDEEGGVTVNLEAEEDDEVPFDANLADVLPPDVLSRISSDLMGKENGVIGYDDYIMLARKMTKEGPMPVSVTPSIYSMADPLGNVQTTLGRFSYQAE